jgi:hypothetical protein
MAERKTRIRLFNVKFSPNLGDGLLSECLEQAMTESGCDASGTYSVDLSGRTQYSRGTSARSTVLKVLDRLPAFLRPIATALPRQAMVMGKWRPHYERHLEGADAIAVGGGNLFTDMDLNFPIKVSNALDLAAGKKLPAAIYGVGVSSKWSATGVRIMRASLAKAKPAYVSVRDAASKSHFDRLFADAAGRQALIVRDPGLMIGRFAPERMPGSGRGLGLCITSSVAIRYHSAEAIEDGELGLWYIALCKAVAKRGERIVAFTNGSPEDEDFLDTIEDRLREASVTGFERRRPDTPNELVALISAFSCLVAHRMHAVIAAVSLGVPVFALLWDEKVEAFMESVGMSDSTAFVRTGNEDEVADRILSLAQAPLGYDRAGLIDEAFLHARGLYAALAR